MSDPANMPDRRALLSNALQKLQEMQARLDAAEGAAKEPIAIIGLGCRFPGGADTPDRYWTLLRDGVNAVREVPADRWDVDAFYDANPEAPGKSYTRHGGFLDQIDRFDPQFFGISPREALTLDPQQRLVLEVGWEALEHAGVASPAKLRGSRTGVFIGIGSSDYAQLQMAGGVDQIDAYTGSGGGLCFAAGRFSYCFGLQGPSLSVDTACSSSLVAVHLACQSLRTGECRLAVAGAVNVIAKPDLFVYLSKVKALAPDGRCKVFDAAADGFVRGEGCGMIVLKRLSDAKADGDNILAVIRGSAVNQDGASTGLTVPNGPAQQAVIAEALARGGIDPSEVDYVEAHGTGTSLGDPIEVGALMGAFGPGRTADRPLTIASVKTNLGHLEAAAGIASLIKVVLILRHGEIPPHLHYRSLNPAISFGAVPVVIPTQRTPWRAGSRQRLAGISSFGLSGTNAHLVVAEAPPAETPADVPDRPLHLLALSARSAPALQELAARHAQHLATHPGLPVGDVTFTANTGRAHFSHRLACVAPTGEQLREQLAAFAGGSRDAGLSGVAELTRRGRVAFLFTGQGAQYAGMGRRLYATQPSFRRTVDRVAELLSGELARPLLEVMFPAEADSRLIDETGYAQPALFALQCALADLWRSWGVEPSLLVGHSIGEYAAAYASGVMSLEGATKLVAARGRLMQALPRGGAMVAVTGDLATIRQRVDAAGGQVSLAAHNSPTSFVLSGPEAAVEAIATQLAASGARTKRLAVSHAFHSALMEPMLRAFEDVARTVEFNAPTITWISTLTGEPVSGAVDARYWSRQIRETVRLADAFTQVRSRGIELSVEIGPSPVLVGLARENGLEKPGWVGSLRRGRDDWSEILTALGTLYTQGATIDWAGFDRDFPRRRVPLPSYPFQRERFWSSPQPAVPAGSAGEHPLLGTHVELASSPGEHLWLGTLDLQRAPWIDDHRVQGVAVFPATAYIEMAIASTIAAAMPPPFVLKEIKIEKSLSLQGDDRFDLQTRLTVKSPGVFLFSVHSRRHGTGGSWTRHATGVVAADAPPSDFPPFDAAQQAALRQRSVRELEGAEFYRVHRERGNQWGPCFQGVSRVWQGAGEALTEITMPASIATTASHYLFHPALSDTSGHVLTATIPLEKTEGPRGGAFVGAGIDEIRFHRRPAGRKFFAHAKVRNETGDPANVLSGDVAIYGAEGELIAETIGARLWYLDTAQQKNATPDVADWFYEPRWEIQPLAQAPKADALAGTWIVLPDQHGIGEALVSQLRSVGAEAVVATSTNPDDFAGLIASARAKGPPLRGAIHLWSLDLAGAEKAGASACEMAETLGPVGALRLLQALERASLPSPARLCLVTRGAQPVEGSGDLNSPLQSVLWGLGRTIAVESGDFWKCQLDLDPAASASDAATAIVHELTQSGAEDQVAFRRGGRYVLRLARRAKNPSPPRQIAVHADAAYLITGGLGGIGLEVARWLAARGARNLVLAGRTPLPGRAQWDTLTADSPEAKRVAAVKELEAAGVRVEPVVTDFARAEEVEQLARHLGGPGRPPLRGIFHAAGIMQYEPLSELEPAQMRAILAAKVTGGWLLHRCFADAPLDFFVLFSSSATLLGSPMLGAYSAANAFLDALAHYRRAQEKPALSVDWAIWAETGMITRVTSAQGARRAASRGASRGIGMLPTRQALEALARLLEDDAVQTGVMPIDWDEWQKMYGGLSAAPYLSLLVKGATGSVEADTGQRERLLAASEADRPAVMQAYLARQIARILMLPESDIQAERPISTLGFDSLMAIELRKQLEADLRVNIAMARLIQGPTPAELGVVIYQQLVAGGEPKPSPAAAAPEQFDEGVL